MPSVDDIGPAMDQSDQLSAILLDKSSEISKDKIDPFTDMFSQRNNQQVDL